MITRLIHVLGPGHGPMVHRFLAAVLTSAILQGITFALLVPTLRAVVEHRIADAIGWCLALAGIALLAGIAYYVQALAGFSTATTSTGALYRRIGDQLAALGVGWFTAARLGRLTQLTTAGVGQITVAFAHLLDPLVTGIVTPLTVTVAMLFFDWRFALALAVTIPILALVYRASTRAIAVADATVDEAIGAANDAIVEFARCQAVLRPFYVCQVGVVVGVVELRVR
ncbi:ABC transporter transmembrane domain-containing protein [Cumulibacter soli]|uniref:ABC transporter transmembrane domain-containing protein n=1 Tax=Cumulibacter soli TaxID=2546344 RepID=UPI0010681025|nr:ABC transporter transmembrane domain-containing protein [Cumulibacter soli]